MVNQCQPSQPRDQCARDKLEIIMANVESVYCYLKCHGWIGKIDTKYTLKVKCTSSLDLCGMQTHMGVKWVKKEKRDTSDLVSKLWIWMPLIYFKVI